MITDFIASDLKTRAKLAGTQVGRQADRVGYGAALAGQSAKHSARMAGEKVKTGAAALGGTALGSWLGDGDDLGADHQTLSNSFISRLADEVEGRLDSGESLKQALADALRERAPILLEPRDRTSTWLKGAATVALVGLGVNYAFKWITGRSLIERARATFSNEPAYRPVHGTAGAEMPNPRASGTTASPRPAFSNGNNAGA